MKSSASLILMLLFLTQTITASPYVSQTDAGIVVSEQPYAVQVGADILKQGGNAVDAATAVGYALAVVHPCCGNIGGGGFMLIHFANGKNTVINFREQAPSAISPSLFLDKQGNQINSSTFGYLAVGIPGTVMGINTALQKYGTLSLKTIMQPAIDLASHGYILNHYDAAILAANATVFLTQPNIAKIFLKDGAPLQAGDKLIQNDLATTLTLIAKQGSHIFYQGEITNKIVAASKQNGGILTNQDFANYHIKEQQPISCNYRGYQVLTIPPPGSGATVCEILNITSGYPLSLLGFHTALGTHYIVEAMRYAYADRNTYFGDPDFVQVPIETLLSPQYAASVRQKITPYTAGDSQKIGFIANQEQPQTTSYIVADKAGNVVVVTYTINGFFGAKVIAGDTGFFLNNELDDFTLNLGTPNFFGLVQGSANLIAPGKRPLSSIAPVIILKNNQLFMAIGTPGGSTIPTQTVEAIEDVIDYRMNIHQAVNASRFHMQWLPDIIYMEPDTFSLRVISQLNSMGYHLHLGSPYKTFYWGSMAGIWQDLKTKKLEGAAQN